MKKRIFALILSMTLSFSFMLSGILSPMTIHAAEGDVTLGKTAEWVDEENGVAKIELAIDNEIEPLVTTVKTRIVLVIDSSGSMSGTPLSNVKTAAKKFVTDLLSLSTATSDVEIAVVDYASTATVLQNFSSSASTLNSRIDSIYAGGGTFTQDGIKVAQGLLDAVTAENEIIVVLSDGEPTYSYRVTGASGITHENCSSMFNHGSWTVINPVITSYSSEVVGSGGSYSLDSGDRYGVNCDAWPNPFHGSPFPANNGIPTIYEAGLAKAKGTEIYSIAYDTTTIAAEVMGGVATDASHAVASSNAAAAFAAITDSITQTILATGGMVTDVMGGSSSAGLSYQFDVITNNASYPVTLTDPAGNTTVLTVTATSTPVAYDPVTHSLSWNLSDANGAFMKGVYKLAYYVQLDDSGIAPGTNAQIDTNNSATISFIDLDGETQTMPFPSPTLTYSSAQKFTVVYQDSFTTAEGGFTSQTHSVTDGDPLPAFVGPNGVTPEHPGYRFTGWTPAEESPVTRDITYTANWVQQFTVTYTDGSGSEDHFTDYVVTVDTGAGVPDYITTSPLHSDPSSKVFDGWQLIVPASGSTPSTVTENLVFEATWRDGSIYSHTVTYQSVDHCTFTLSDSFEENSAIPGYWGSPNPPICAGYEFDGWTASPTGLNVLSEDVTFTARWNEIFTITYVDGVADEDIFADQSYEVANGGSTPSFLWEGTAGNPVRTGYRFTGWDSSVSPTVTGNKTYTATWAKEITVTYKDNVPDIDLFLDVVYTGLIAGEQTPEFDDSAATPTNVPVVPVLYAGNYTFVGWDPTWETHISGDQDIVYIAVWEYRATMHKVIYQDGVGGTVFTDVEFDVEAGNATPQYDADNKPVRDGYTFVKWAPDWSATVTDDVTYVAVWKKGSPKTGVVNDTNFYLAIAGGAVVIGALAYFVLNKKTKKVK